MQNTPISVCLILVGAACATPSTTIVAPPCATFDGADPAELVAPNAIVVDNTLSLPFSSRTVHVRYPDGYSDDVSVSFTQQDPSRFAYAGCLACGGLALVGYGAYLANDGDPSTDDAALVPLVSGATLAAIGVVGPLTGWRAGPKAAVLVDECAEHRRKEVAPPAPAASSPAPPAPPSPDAATPPSTP